MTEAIRRRAGWTGLVLVLGTQGFLGLWQIDDDWVRGHVGYNSSAFFSGARNSLRWGTIFPVKYYTGTTPPPPSNQYTHHPLGMNLAHQAVLLVLGEHRWAVRSVHAFHALLAAFAMFWVVRRLWSDEVGLLASAVYVAFPINAIYTNMANHSSAFVAYSLFALLFHIEHVRARAQRQFERARRWFFLCCGAFFLAAMWDWPAYYVASAIALHGAAVAISHRDWRGLGWTVGFGLWVLCPFVLHFGLTAWITGGLDELAGTLSSRTAVDPTRFWDHLRRVPVLMFGPVVLWVGGLWLLFIPPRAFTRRLGDRDLVPITFAFAGGLHYGLFRWSAVVHSYWAWSMLPFFAIALSTTALWLGERAREGAVPRVGAIGRLATPAVVLVLLVPFAVHAIEVTVRGRSAGGSMWFPYPFVRPQPADTYTSGRVLSQFAQWVNTQTTRDTGVLVHSPLDRRRPEHRLSITMDRRHRWVKEPPRTPPRREGDLVGWVLIGERSALPSEQRRGYAARHRYVERGPFFFVDFRTKEGSVEVYRMEETEPTILYRWLVTPFERPLRYMRDEAAEALVRARAAPDHQADSGSID